MRTPLLLLVGTLLLGCNRGPEQTVRFTGPEGVDHAAAAKVLEQRLSEYGSVDEVSVNLSTITLRGRFKELSPAAVKALGRRGQLSFHVVEGEDRCAPDPTALREDLRAAAAPGKAWLPLVTPSQEGQFCALLVGDAKLTEADVASARASTDELGGAVLTVEFTPAGGELFGALTRQIKDERLAIVVDGAVQSAPRVMSEIPGGRAQVSFGRHASLDEVRAFARALTAGRLPAPYQGALAK